MGVCAILNAQPSSATSNLSLNLTIAGGSDLISLDIASIKSNGTFKTSDTSSNNITVSTNNYTGYTLGILAKNNSNDNSLSFTDTNNNNTISTISSITSPVSATNYADDTYAETNSLNNTWGYRPSKYNSEDNTINNYYYPGPTGNTTTILDVTNQPNPSTPNNYNIAIGARIDSSTTPGTYTNTFVITAVANNISYTVNYDANAGSDTVTNMPTTPQEEIVDATTPTITLSNNKPTRDGYAFMGWCTTQTADDAVCPSEATEYQPGGSYDVDYTTDSLTLYARWAGLSNITFTAGSNINTMMIADSSENYKPYYITTGNSKTFTNAIPDTKYIVTVIPQANYKLDSWSGDNKGLSGLASDTLLTTNYIVPASTTSTLTATGTNDYDTTYPYPSMQDPTLTNATCTEAMNVTDIRDGKSYTVAPISGYCYTLSNLRLAGSTSTATVTLDSSTSDLTQGSTFTMPRQDMWEGHYCEAKMRYNGQEYFYNWYAAMANPTTGVVSSTTCADATRDAASLGSICPAGWELSNLVWPLWGDGSNPGMLAAFKPPRGYWWMSTRFNDSWANFANFNGRDKDINGLYNPKSSDYSVRCVHSN